MVNNIIILKSRNGFVKIVFSSAETEQAAREMAEKLGDDFISFIPIESSPMFDSCVMDDGYRIIVEAFLTRIYNEGMLYGVSSMKKELTTH